MREDQKSSQEVILNRDNPTFDHLEARYRERILKWCNTLLNDPAEAEDARQEVLLQVWKKLPDFQGTALTAWIMRIATNNCLNRRRPLKKKLDAKASSLSDPALEDQNGKIEAGYSSVEESLFIEQTLALLKAKGQKRRPPWDALDWDILLLRIMDDRTMQEIAILLQEPLGTILYRYNRRIKPVLALLGEELKQEYSASPNKTAR